LFRPINAEHKDGAAVSIISQVFSITKLGSEVSLPAVVACAQPTVPPRPGVTKVVPATTRSPTRTM